MVRIVSPCIFPAASGFLPSASRAPFPISPIPIPGQIAPSPIASAIASTLKSINYFLKI